MAPPGPPPSLRAVLTPESKEVVGPDRQAPPLITDLSKEPRVERRLAARREEARAEELDAGGRVRVEARVVYLHDREARAEASKILITAIRAAVTN